MILNSIKRLLLKKKIQTEYDFNFFKEMVIFKHFYENEFNDFTSSLFISKKYEKDEMIFKENYPIVVIYIVKSGKIKLYQENDGIRFEITELIERTMFGEVSLFIDMQRVYSAVAMEDSEIIAINKVDLVNYIKYNHGTGVKLLWNLAEYISSQYIEVYPYLKKYENK
jgi:CRP-like cAMP-binding protein